MPTTVAMAVAVAISSASALVSNWYIIERNELDRSGTCDCIALT